MCAAKPPLLTAIRSIPTGSPQGRSRNGRSYRWVHGTEPLAGCPKRVMKPLVVSCLILAAMAMACGKKRTSPPASTERQDWVVLPEKEALALTRPCSRSFPPDLSGYWTPGEKDVERAETRFQEALNRTLRRASKEDREGSPGRWYAQYAGFFRNGHKVIYVNAVGQGIPGSEWRQRVVTICDGGLMSFGAVLDLDRDAVDSFEFNGTIAGHIQMRDAENVDAARPTVPADGTSPSPLNGHIVSPDSGR